MPYSNIVWIKLFLSLFEQDDRFLYQLNESQQLLYIKLLYLAGATDNKIPKNINFICNKVNYHHEQGCFTADIDRIKSIFPRFIECEDCYYFNNFHELHNRVSSKDLTGASKGHPKELQRDIPEKEKEQEKEHTIGDVGSPVKGHVKSGVSSVRPIIQRIINTLIDVKGFDRTPDLINHYYKRYGKTAKELAQVSKNNGADVVEAIPCIGNEMTQKGLTWELETVLKWFPAYLTKGKDFMGNKKGQSDAGLRSIR